MFNKLEIYSRITYKIYKYLDRYDGIIMLITFIFIHERRGREKSEIILFGIKTVEEDMRIQKIKILSLNRSVSHNHRSSTILIKIFHEHSYLIKVSLDANQDQIFEEQIKMM